MGPERSGANRPGGSLRKAFKACFFIAAVLAAMPGVAAERIGKEVREALSGGVTRSEIVMRSGATYLLKGHLEKAKSVFNTGLKFDFNNADLHFLNALTYHQSFIQGHREDLNLALSGYRIAYLLDHELWGVAHLQIGKLYLEARDYHAAKMASARAVQADHESTEALWVLAQAAALNGDADTASWAVAELEQAVGENPELVRIEAMVTALAGHSNRARSLAAEYADATRSDADAHYVQTRVEQILSMVPSDGASSGAGSAGAAVDRPATTGEAGSQPHPGPREADIDRSASNDAVAAAPVPGARDAQWLLAQSPAAFTVQLASFSTEDLLRNYLGQQQDPSLFGWYAVQRGGKLLFVANYGQYASKAEAMQASDALPPGIGKVDPWVRQMKMVQEAIRGGETVQNAPATDPPAAPGNDGTVAQSSAPEGTAAPEASGTEVAAAPPAEGGEDKVSLWFRCDPTPEVPSFHRVHVNDGGALDESIAAEVLPAPCPSESPEQAQFAVTVVSTTEMKSGSVGINLLDGLAGIWSLSRDYQTDDQSGSDRTYTVARTNNFVLSNAIGSSGNDVLRYSLNVANSAYSKSEVLLHPTISAIDRVPAILFVGSTLTLGVGGTNGSSATIEDKSVGISLSITPTFTSDGEVIVSLRMTRAAIAPTSTQLSGILLQQNRAALTASAKLKAGDTFVLSGLTEDQKDVGNSGVPGLQKIPVLRRLFNTATTDDEAVSLIALVTYYKSPIGLAQVASKVARKGSPEIAQSMVPPGLGELDDFDLADLKNRVPAGQLTLRRKDVLVKGAETQKALESTVLQILHSVGDARGTSD